MIGFRNLVPALALWIALPGAALSQPPLSGSGFGASASESHGSSSGVMALRADVGAILRSAGWGSPRYGVLVVSLDRGDTLVSINPDLPFAPASNMKLYSTAAALYYLGPDFRYSTYLFADGPVRDGVLLGDLVLYGTGDPSISRRLLEDPVAVFERMADALAAAGVREVTGAVVGDGSYFDDAWLGPEWEQDDLMSWYAVPVGGLSFEENLVELRVTPGGAPGESAIIRTVPATRGLALRNEVRTLAGARTSVDFEHGPEGLIVRGRIRSGGPGVSRRVPVVDPANYAAAALHAVLEARGIAFASGVTSVRSAGRSPIPIGRPAGDRAAPDARPRLIAVHLSPPLDELARSMNHVSHNLFAEALLKTTGRASIGEGSFAGGADAVQAFLGAEGLAAAGPVTVVDGSGLSRGNRATPRSTVELLAHLAGTDLADAYLRSLPRAGEEGGLDRMHGTEAAGNLRAKTGTIRRVSALSGYVTAAGGERLAFSIMVNDVPATWRAKQVEDRIGARLARFDRIAPGPPMPSPR